MPEIDYVRVHDSELRRTYTDVRSAVAVTDTLSILEDRPALDEYGNPARPEFDVDLDDVAQPYAGWLKADLEDEVAARNSTRDEADQIQVEGSGKVADLVAALEADNLTHPELHPTSKENHHG